MSSEGLRNAAVGPKIWFTTPPTAAPSWFYLSFADPGRPTGEQFLGGAYVEGASTVDAIGRSHALGINPGGEVQAFGPLPADVFEHNVPVEDRERLLTRAEVEGH